MSTERHRTPAVIAISLSAVALLTVSAWGLALLLETDGREAEAASSADAEARSQEVSGVEGVEGIEDAEALEEAADEAAGGSGEAPDESGLVASEAQLDVIVDEMSAAYGDSIAVVVTDLSNGATASANADTGFVSASIYKLFVAYGVYRLIDEGRVVGTDDLSGYGVSDSVSSCLDLMLRISDNACGVALGSLFGWSELDAMLQQEGYSGTVLNNYDASGALISDKRTTANDVARLLDELYAGELISAASTDEMIALLIADEIDYMLPSGLPAGTAVAHKVGYLGEYQHDAGIIYGGDRDMLVVMLTSGWTAAPESEAAAAFSTLSQRVWEYAGG